MKVYKAAKKRVKTIRENLDDESKEKLREFDQKRKLEKKINNGNLNHEAKEKVTKATKKERGKKKKANNLRKS